MTARMASGEEICLLPYFCAKVERINFLVQKEGILTHKNGINRVEAGEF